MRASRATRISRAAARHAASARKRSASAAKPVRKLAPKLLVPPQPVLYRFCKAGWAVLVEKLPSQQGTRFVCPFCTRSHRVSGPVRGFRKVRKAQWVKLARVEE